MPASTRLPRPLRAALLLAGLAGAAQAEDAPSIVWPEPGGRATISRAFKGSPITVGVSSRTGGAIDSLTWAGTQFINAHDHGRELQSASSYDGYGECLNPTEAGSDSDGTGPRSTTRLTELKVGPDTLQTRAQMAYWIEPGRVTGSCPKGPGPHAGPRSDDVLAKTVTLGAAGVANAIAYRATYITAQAHESATFEAATAYMPPDFTAFWSLDPATGQSQPLSAGPGEQAVPVILATPDGSRAMGVYSPALPQPTVPNAGYGRFDFSTLPGSGNATVKWNCAFRENNVPAGAHSYTCYVVVGTLQDVRAGLVALRAALTGGRPAPLPAIPAPAAVRAPGVALYVGTQQGCNAGEVTIDPGYKGCATAPIGATLAQPSSPADAPVYAGTAAGLDAGLVTNNPHHLDAGTRPIGYLAAAGPGGTPLYVGLQGGCNAGVVSTNPAHLNCRAAPLGLAVR
ncbi:hypothetical protein [Methylobacterium pseudosasicola]|uniref:Uncharacterized protein n=1 Tax=Methylobacterium pseudosasicola TaxID=582667 RepID=A0A1I4P4C1_9HYPH|nr:hypothetical protein [Methylobacterium pseudosasicola]SFM22632.1 hypothetical protein SAMN05192568_102343 [Methylobacterium pseudosasicola]